MSKFVDLISLNTEQKVVNSSMLPWRCVGQRNDTTTTFHCSQSTNQGYGTDPAYRGQDFLARKKSRDIATTTLLVLLWQTNVAVLTSYCYLYTYMISICKKKTR